MITKFDTYLLKDLWIACIFITLTLAGVVFLTQSLRFLELVINSGASSGTFWVLTLLALPRFFEIILPLAVMAATIFVFHRMSIDSELVAVKAAGFSPLRIARPVILTGLFLTVFLWVISMWLAPVALSSMQKMQQIVKAQISSYLFRENVFNSFGSGLTFYIRERSDDGTLKGLLIHDERNTGKGEPASTITAKKGTITSQEDGYEVVVYDGSRQVFDKSNDTLQKLNFERYTIALPDSSPVQNRWREPDERTIFELLKPNPEVKRDLESTRDFVVEIHKRLTGPLLALSFTLIASCCMLLGPASRRGNTKKITVAIVACMLIQGLFVSSFNLARQHDIGFIMMYALVFIPLAVCGVLLSNFGAALRRKWLYKTADTV